MKRSFPSPAREALCAFVALVASASACAPANDVEPGAPVLTKMILVAPGPTPVTITSATADCASGIATGDACDPSMDGLCRQTPGWCSCVADAMDMTMGAWDCEPFQVLAVVAVFDRLLDTTPFDAVYPAPSLDVVTGSAGAGAPQFDLATDYASTGTPMGVTPLFSFLFNGNFRNNGPSLFSTPDPGFPSGSPVTVNLQASLVRAKDGTTPFMGEGLLQGGTVLFTTPAFMATSIAPPDMGNPASIVFNNAVGDDVIAHITITAGNADITAQVTLVASGMVVTATPKTAWPAGATITIAVDATAKNKLGQTIDAAKSDQFTAM
jgi:hypothetical protein